MMWAFRKSDAFKRKDVTLQASGSVKRCRACGDKDNLKRVYQMRTWGMPEHVLVVCTSCGAPHYEQLKDEP